MKLSLRHAFERHLKHRYSLRLHMSAILLATTFSGILFSKILLFLGIVDFKIRYPVAVVFSYLVFFACVKLWLSWISSINESKASVVDWIDLSTPASPGGVESVTSICGGNQFFGGGSSGGGGVSGSFDQSDTIPMQNIVLQEYLSKSDVSSSEGIGDAVEGAADVLGDNGIVVAVVVLAGLVITILISSILVVYSAPTILAEAAFEGVLAASLVKKTRIFSDKAWAGSILKATWKPFAVALGVAFLGGAVLHKYYPQAVRLADILFKG
ncbi:MAG: hypothetical protein ABFD75_05005 [Smithella sp.]